MTGAYTQACLAILIHFHVQTVADNAERCAIMVFFTHHYHCMQDCGSTKNKQQSCQPMTFCLLSTQQIQALLTLFSKFFSFFPQGTCLLPVSSSCLSLHETYHPLCTPFPKSVILKMHTVHEKHMMTNRNSTFNIPSAQPIMSVHMRKSGKPIGHRASRVTCNALTRHTRPASTGWNTQHG